MERKLWKALRRIYWAINGNDLEAVRDALVPDLDLDQYIFKTSKTFYGEIKIGVLHRAAFLGRTEIVRLLLDHGASASLRDYHLVGSRRIREDEPIHWAIEGCQFGVVKILLDNGADVSFNSGRLGTPIFHL